MRFPPLRDALFRAVVLLALIVASAVFTLSQDYQSPRGQHESRSKQQAEQVVSPKSFIERTLEDPTAFFTASLSFLTSVLAVVGVVQIYYLNRSDITARISADAAKQAADVARDSLMSANRSWVSVTVRVASDMIIDEQGARVSISVRYANIGRSPALNVFCFPCLCARTNDRRTRDLIEKLTADNPRFQNIGGLGFNILPGDAIEEVYIALISPEDLTTAGFGRSTRHDCYREGSALYMAIDVYGVVRYSDTISTSWHRTPFWYNMIKTDGSGTYPKSNGTIPMRDMALRPEIFGAQIVD